MENIMAFPNREVIEQEAAEWLVRLDGDTVLSAAELQALREWISRSPAHHAELLSVSEFWSDQSLVALPIPLEQLCYEAPKNKTRSAGWLWFSPWHDDGFTWRSFAAVSVVVALIGLIFSAAGLPTWINGVDVNSALYASAIGEQRNITLPDGSSVYLNTNSQVKVDYGEGYRNIQLLQGEAHFDVVKQKQRPFRVYAGRGRVQAVGTAFTVFIRDNSKVDVAVTEGTVSLAVLDTEIAEPVVDHRPDKSTSAAAGPSSIRPPSIPDSGPTVSDKQADGKQTEYYLAMPANELGLLEAGEETTILTARESQVEGRDNILNVKQVAQEELARRGAWRNGLLIFTGDSLDDVVKEVRRYTTLTIEIVDPELKKVRIGGRFSVNSTREFFDALEANFGLRVTQLGYNRVEISVADKNKNDKK